MFENISDEVLAEKAHTDKAAVTELVSRYLPTVEIIANKISPAAFEDLRQEGLMALLKAIQSYRSGLKASFSTYASVCIRNRMLSTLKKNSLSGAADISEIPDDELSELTSLGVPEDIVIESEETWELSEIVFSVLSETERRVFELYLAGMSYEMIGARLGMKVKAVDNAMQRARHKLKSLLGDNN
jgi:RNA polymerase sporulation-specific sigma factor